MLLSVQGVIFLGQESPGRDSAETGARIHALERATSTKICPRDPIAALPRSPLTGSERGADADLLEVIDHVGWVGVDAVSTGRSQFVGSVAA